MPEIYKNRAGQSMISFMNDFFLCQNQPEREQDEAQKRSTQIPYGERKYTKTSLQILQPIFSETKNTYGSNFAIYKMEILPETT